MIAILRSPIRSQRITAHMTLIAVIAMGVLLVYAGWRYEAFTRIYPTSQAVVQHLMEDISQNRWDKASSFLTEDQLAQYEQSVRGLGPIMSYSLESSERVVGFPATELTRQDYDVAFVKGKRSVSVTTTLGLGNSDVQYRLIVIDPSKRSVANAYSVF